MTDTITLDHVLKLAEQLSPLDKVRLIERVAPQLGRELRTVVQVVSLVLSQAGQLMM